MVATNVKNQQAVQNMAGQIRAAFFLSLLTNLYELYDFFNTAGDLRQGVSIMLGILGTGLLWFISKELRSGRKLALYYWLGLLLAGASRWVLVNAALEWNILSMILLALLTGITLKLVVWTRNSVLV